MEVLSRFLSVDPITKQYPELTPYQFASNTPLWATDLDGLEAYFTNSGNFVGWGNDKSPKAPVIFVADAKNVAEAQKQKGETLKLNITEFIDRVNWQFGESGGVAPDYYASAIDNAASVEGESSMYQGMTTNNKNKKTTEELKEIYFHQEKTSSTEKSKENYTFFHSLVRTKDRKLNLEGVNAKQGENLADGYNRKQIRNIIATTKKILTGETKNVLLDKQYKWCDNCEYDKTGARAYGHPDKTIVNVQQKSGFGFPANIFFYFPKNSSKSPNNSQPLKIIKLDKLPR